MEKKEILRLVTNRPCSKCGRKHSIFHISYLPKGRKLVKLDCALPFEGYVGSIILGDMVLDYYNYDMLKRVVVIEPEEENEKCCLMCEKQISQEEYDTYDGLCEECAFEFQDLDEES